MLAVLYEDQTFEIFDLNLNIEQSIFYFDLSDQNMKFINFDSFKSVSNNTTLNSLYILFINSRNRVFKLGPLFLPKLFISNENIGQIELCSSQSDSWNKIYNHISQMTGNIFIKI